MQVFRILENPNEIAERQAVRNSTITARSKFIQSILDNRDIRNLEDYISVELLDYEIVSFAPPLFFSFNVLIKRY